MYTYIPIEEPHTDTYCSINLVITREIHVPVRLRASTMLLSFAADCVRHVDS